MGRTLKDLPNGLPQVFTRLDAHRLGVGHGRLQRNDVAWIAPGTYARTDGVVQHGELGNVHPSEAWKRDQWRRARQLGKRLGPGQFFSHNTAAAIWNLPIFDKPDGRLDIGCLLPARGSRSHAFRTHRFTAGSIEVVDFEGVPVLSAASTWLVLAAGLGRMSAVAMGDAVIHTPRMPGTARLLRTPLATVNEIERLVSLPYRRGRDRLRKYLGELSPRAASPPESHLRLLLSDWGAPNPELDFDVYDRDGRLLGCSEFAFPEFRLALEYEGDHHRTDLRQWERDIEKYRDYAGAGWEALRVTRSLLYREPDTLRRLIWAALERRYQV